MPWYQNIVPESIKKNVCAYLLQRYLGQFFEEKLTRDQLNVDLYNGRGSVEKISLDVQALNELGEKQNWPVEFIDGYIESLHISIPWTSILKDASFVEVKGLKITLQPKQRHESATSMFESMWNSMTSSIQLAEECAKQDAANSTNTAQQSYEGIELFAQTIDSILSRVNVKFIDTILQIEHVPKDSITGVGIIVNIDLIEYSDEAGSDPTPEEATDLSSQDSKKAYLVQSYTVKNFVFKGITFSTVEFSSKARTFSRSVLLQSQNVEKEEEESFITMFERNSLNDFQQSKIEGDDVETVPVVESSTKTQSKDLSGYRHVILLGKLSSTQEIRVKLKQSEHLSGPKVLMDMNFGSFVMFLSPRQFHLLLELANGLASPDIQDTSNVPSRPKLIAKPMTGLDYQRVEQELQQQIQPLTDLNITGLHSGRGWSTAVLDESDNEDNFLPMKNTVSGMYDSALSGISSSMDSSVNSSLASSFTEASHRTKKRMANIETDPTADITFFQIRLASLAIVLLHEDLLIQSTGGDHVLALSSVQQMQQTAREFFDRMENFVLSAHKNKDFENSRSILDKACNLNHLRLLAAPIQIKAEESVVSKGFAISVTATAAKLQILECLYGPDSPVQVVPLLTFSETVVPTVDSGKPNLTVNIKYFEKISRESTYRRQSHTGGPTSRLWFTLSKCTVEFDMTIIDRIAALLNPPEICVIEKMKYNPWTTGVPQLQTVSSSNSEFDFKITSESMNVKLRFPIPDFRPLHDMNRNPWWKRHVRPDYLSIVLIEAVMRYKSRTNDVLQEYDIHSRQADIIYYESENSVGLPIAKLGSVDVPAQYDFGPSLSIKVFPKKAPDLEEPELESDPMTTSFYGDFINRSTEQNGPFSSKKVVHESDTPHPKSQKDETDELIMPGEKEEIDSFVKLTTESSKIQINLDVPTITAQLKSKHIYELIYNRINNDLLLWQSSAPKTKKEPYEGTNYPTFSNLDKNIIVDGQDTFSLCKSGIQYESESDTEEDSEGSTSNIFYSAYENKLKMAAKPGTMSPSKAPNQTDLTFTINIGKGMLYFNAPVRCSTTNKVLPGLQGEFCLNFEQASVFIVSGYQGDDNLGYVCLQLHNAQFYHCDIASIPSQCPPLKELGTAISRHLHPTIYRSGPGTLVTSTCRGGIREMLTMAIKIRASHETHHVKTVQIAVGLNKCTLRHKMCTEPNSWISHLLDFFNVQDYTISGYHAKDVLTELHLHLWDCGIDYRPLHLPIRSVITVGAFSMSSHLSAQANSSTLRFIFEECGLFLSEKAPPKNGVASMATVDLKKDYVKVIEMGLFELSLKTNDKKSGMNPHIDLRISNNVLNIHTCADSCRMLMQLITYFASDGDITNSSTVCNETPFSSPKHQIEQELIAVEPQNISNLSRSQHEQVNTLIGEAMEDSDMVEVKQKMIKVQPQCISSLTKSQQDRVNNLIREAIEDVDVIEERSIPHGNTGAQLFFFPDETQLAQLEPIARPLPQVTLDLGDVAYSNKSSSDTDDDFCIIGNEPGLGLFPRNGLPDIKWLTSDPVRVLDNHYTVPLGKTDLLKPPKHFPTPVMRYTLCDMTVIWHMYGGNDFKLPDSESKKTVNFSDARLDDTVKFLNTDKNEVKFTSSADKRKAKLNWTLRGGVNRDHSVHMELQLNKVRFQHEQYPETATQASRQVLIISEVEIRDRLESSQINKFLYQYSSQARPKQSHSNMVVIKAVHIKPDPKLTTQECCLKISLLPLRFNIDQDALLFLISYVNEMSGSGLPEEKAHSSKHNTPTHHPPIMTIGGEEEETKRQAEKVVTENLISLIEDNKREEESESTENSSNNMPDGSPIFFRNVIFAPDVPIRLDYHGKHVDMTHGPLPGLLMGLGQLNCSEIRLKRISHRHGLLGIDKLMAHLLKEWLSDIRKNQLPSLLGGVGPMYSVVQLFQGVRDLFWLPIEQYQKDGRIVRGLQRGANSFTTSTAMAALELTSRLIHLIQITAETAYDMLSPGPSLRRIAKAKGKKKRYHQPQDIREGMTNAIMLVKEGIGETADNIVQVAAIEKEQKGYSGAVGGVLRQLPPTFLKPIIIASEATSNVLGGMRSQLVPDARREAKQKWRSDE